VHVLKGKGKGESEVLINLGEPETPGGLWESVSVREIKGMKDRDVVAAVLLVQEHLVTLRKRWREIHDGE
jgi:hypothetical protein